LPKLGQDLEEGAGAARIRKYHRKRNDDRKDDPDPFDGGLCSFVKEK